MATTAGSGNSKGSDVDQGEGSSSSSTSSSSFNLKEDKEQEPISQSTDQKINLLLKMISDLSTQVNYYKQMTKFKVYT